MAKADNETLQVIIREWMAGTGISIITRTILAMLQKLEKAYGDDFSIERACEGLDSLAKTAGQIKTNLEQEFARISNEPVTPS